jgi:hypothetical protein
MVYSVGIWIHGAFAFGFFIDLDTNLASIPSPSHGLERVITGEWSRGVLENPTRFTEAASVDHPDVESRMPHGVKT